MLQPRPCGLHRVREVEPRGRSAEEKMRMCRWEAVRKKRRETSSGPRGPRLSPDGLGVPLSSPRRSALSACFPHLPRGACLAASPPLGRPWESVGIFARGCQGSSGRSSGPVSSVGLLAGPLPAPEQPRRRAGACRGVWALTRRSRWRAWTPLPFFIYYFLKLIDFNWRIVPLFYCDGFCRTSV